MKPIDLRGKHIYALAEFHKDDPIYLFYRATQLIHALSYIGSYGFKHGWNEYRTFKEILTNPLATVKITDTLDDICKPYCSLRKKGCETDEGSSLLSLGGDSAFAKKFGLEIGKEYPAKKIAELIRERYKEILK